MRALLKDNRINTMFLKAKSFVISLDTLKNYNQIKGRTITAYFVSKVIPATTTLTTNSKSIQPSTRAIVSVKARTPAVSLPQVTTATTPAREETSLNRVIVEGNGQSIYYAVDDKNKMIGLNHVECSRMNIEFANNKVGQIRFYGRPDAQLIPPKEFTEDSQKLDGFRWREAEKPTKGQVLWLETPPVEQPPAKKPLKMKGSAKPLAKKSVQRVNS
jgi:hypothetical protein